MRATPTLSSPLRSTVLVNPTSNVWRDAGGGVNDRLGIPRKFDGASYQFDHSVIGDITEVVVDGKNQARGGQVLLAFPGLDNIDILPDFTAERSEVSYPVPRSSGTIMLYSGSAAGRFIIYNVYGRLTNS